MKTTNLQYIFSLMLIVGLLFSCKEESTLYGPDPFPNPSVDNILLNVEVIPQEVTGTRASIDAGDNWSYTGFSTNSGNPDCIGFYSMYGNLSAADGNGEFLNEPMYYKGTSSNTTSSFTSTTMDCDITAIVWNKTAAYFPYSTDMDETGLELRQNVGNDDLRCIDLLFMSNLNTGAQAAGLAGRFSHAFCEIIFIRGEGFKKAEDKDITVVLDKGYSHARIVDNTHTDVSNLKDSWKMVQLVYNDEYSLEEEDCRNWKAWNGADYDEEEAFYVVVPTMTYNDRTKVSYIKIKDDYGTEHFISDLPLYNGSTSLYNGQRYIIEIKMEELVPTAYPYEIKNWDDDEDVTETHALGINSPTEFKDWIEAYNAYISDPSKTDDLLTYGDKIIDNEENIKGWHFYIGEDIDFQNSSDYSSLKISEFKDILDGQHHTISNLLLNTSGLIESITDSGVVTNLYIDAMYIDDRSVTNEGNGLTGTLVKTLNGGTITGCRIDATVIGNGKVGILAGKINSGEVTSNTFTGLLIGSGTSETPKGLAGEISNGTTISGNNLSGVLFTQKTIDHE